MNTSRLEQLCREGKYQDAWWAYSTLVAKGEADAVVHMLGARAARQLGHLYSAVNAIEQALPLAVGEVAGEVRMVYGVILRELGRCQEAITEFERWVRDLGEYPNLDTKYLGSAYYNLGLAYRQTERYNESVQHYAAACKCFRETNQTGYLRMALQNLAWAACYCGRESEAREALTEAAPLCKTPAELWQQKIGEAFLLAVSQDGDLHGVMTLCQTIIEHQGDDLPVAARSQAFWLAGRVGLELGLGDTARFLAEQALWLGAVVGDENRCLTDAARLLNEIERRLAPTA